MRAQLQSLRAVAANAPLRRLELAWLLTSIGVWGGTLALAVYAYDRGGPAAVGLMAFLRALPGAPLAPLLAAVADRTSRRGVMLAASGARATVMLAIAAAVAADASLGLVYALVVVLAITGPAFRPAFVALLPRVARTPAELASANVAASFVFNAGFLAGSLLAGLLLAATSMAAVLALVGAAFAAAVVPLLRIPRDEPPPAPPQQHPAQELVAGARTIAGDPGLREVVTVGSLLFVVDGAVDVLVVIAALGFLGAGEAGAGLLSSAWAAGCMAASGAVLVLLARGRLTGGMVLGAAVFGAALLAVGLVPAVAVAAAALVVFGIGFTVVEVAVETLQQRLAPDYVLGRVAGVTETLAVAGAALGALAGGLLADLIGAQGAFVALGVLAPLAVLLRRRRIGRLEAGAPVADREYRLLRGHPIFAPLSVADAERLAQALEEIRPATGEDVIVQGAVGDRFFLVAEGEVDVVEDGVHRRSCGPGDGVGEIALLRDVPRTATVRARSDTVLLALDRATFLATLTGAPPAARAAEGIAAGRLPAGGT